MKYTDRETDVIVADGFTELNYKQKKLLLASVNPNNAEREKYADALIKICGAGVYNKLKAKLSDADYRQKVIGNLEKRRVECATIKSANYPPQLKEIPVPPLVLYMRGDTSLITTRMFAVVGSRKTTAPVVAECKRMCEALSTHLTVVTGVADGGDSAAAKGAMKNGRAVCVLPGGHDSDCAPNMRLLSDVENSGLTISEYPPKTAARRHMFILRNRIIAGLSEGVLVVSAGEKSGALSTASYCTDYSKDVFAFPYNVGVPSGKGCNNLIKSGAYLCDSENDIFFALGIECRKEEKLDGELDDEERALINLLRENGELHAEKIAEALKIKLTDVVITLSMLEIKGLVIKTGGNSYSAI